MSEFQSCVSCTLVQLSSRGAGRTAVAVHSCANAEPGVAPTALLQYASGQLKTSNVSFD